jgi:hypothetical protein
MNLQSLNFQEGRGEREREREDAEAEVTDEFSTA